MGQRTKVLVSGANRYETETELCAGYPKLTPLSSETLTHAFEEQNKNDCEYFVWRTKRPTTDLHHESNVPENVPFFDSVTRCLAFFSFHRYPISFSCSVHQMTLSKAALFRPALSHHTQNIHSSTNFSYAPSVQKLSPPFKRT